MKRLLLAVIPMVFSGPVWAVEACQEFWFTRNLIMDRAGHCFTSPLGQAIFDNTDCRAGGAVLSDRDRALVRDIQEMEREWNCDIDTRRKDLPGIPNIALRMQMIDIPLADGYESACIGFKGGPFDLRSARHPSAPVTGRIPQGGDIPFIYIEVEGWLFVDTRGADGMGWLQTPDTGNNACEMYAG